MITFTAWFIVQRDNSIRMIDTDPVEMLDHGEEHFGPYSISIRTPKRIEECLKERTTLLTGEVEGE